MHPIEKLFSVTGKDLGKAAGTFDEWTAEPWTMSQNFLQLLERIVYQMGIDTGCRIPIVLLPDMVTVCAGVFAVGRLIERDKNTKKEIKSDEEENVIEEV